MVAATDAAHWPSNRQGRWSGSSGLAHVASEEVTSPRGERCASPMSRAPGVYGIGNCLGVLHETQLGRLCGRVSGQCGAGTTAAGCLSTLWEVEVGRPMGL